MKIDLTLFDDLQAFIMNSLPRIIGVIVYIILAWLILKILQITFKRILKSLKIEALNNKINDNDFIKEFRFDINLTKIILFFIKWITILVLIIIGADLFNMGKVSEGVGEIINFLPTLFSALLIAIVGIFLGSYFKKGIKLMLTSFDINGSNAISSIIFYIILVITFIIALNQLGVNTDIITNNLTIILGALLAASTLAIGLGSRDVIQRLIFGFYSRKNFEIGQKIRIKNQEGYVVHIDNITLTLQAEDKKIVYPIKTIVNQKIEILD
ncbi:small-conductance mechanosensitive channel [Aequorivita sp. Q41]|uniref:mechanosensitive ion channel family protein n=1 Tax=Aequorivita sp. Q41 TaxID=3153300 RepID=UPI003241F6B0